MVYRGGLGAETDAVVVATKDVFEPTYYAFFNSTDQIFYNGAFLPTTTSPPPTDLDPDHDGVIDPVADKTGLTVLFAFSDTPLDVFSGNKITNLPPGRFSRYAILTGRSPFLLQTFATNQRIVTPTNFVTDILDPVPTATTNQLDPISNIYRVTTYYPLRGVAGGNASLTYFRTFGANMNGDPKMLPDLVDKTPFPITCLWFNSPAPCKF